MNRIREEYRLPSHTWDEEKQTAVFAVEGELDHHGARPVREEIDRVIGKYRPAAVVLDLKNVTFMDSAGIGLILGRYAKVTGYGGTLILHSPTGEIMKMLRLAGMDRLLKIEYPKE